ncbi:MAG: hypothetical protein IT364_09940 [Candidatus Hydrogenedentes bacterium]|nr:hypothetical protein [Candidatus Hydrogenedentota bacterium]
MSRRSVLKGAAAAGIASALAAGTGEQGVVQAARRDLIRRENEKPGTTDWQLTYTRVDPDTQYRCPWIEGSVSKASVRAGESLDFMVSVRPDGKGTDPVFRSAGPPQKTGSVPVDGGQGTDPVFRSAGPPQKTGSVPFTIDLYRMGYYGGAGARHLTTLGPFDGVVQEDPPVGEERLRECRWTPCASLTIPEDWVSGVYLGKLSLVNDRWQSYVIFIVRDDREADVLFQCSDNTWQAYNRWPDNFSLYDDGENPWALKSGIRVSYDRPYGKYCQILDAPLSQGSGEFLLWEFPLAYWLEKEGYDVTYCSNTDVHADAACALRAKAFLSVGHDEYWSLEQFNHVKAAVDAGVNVAFLSGNTCCFVTPTTPSTDGRLNRILTRGGCFGGMSEAEAKIMGPFTMEGPDERTLIGARSVMPFNGSGDWIVSDASSWLFDGTGMKNGDRIPGLVGWEFHGEPAPIEGLKVVAEGTSINGSDETAHWTATLYPGPKGNWVFNASTIWWAQGLSSPPGHMLPYSHFGRPHGPDARVQMITENFSKRAIGKHARG